MSTSMTSRPAFQACVGSPSPTGPLERSPRRGQHEQASCRSPAPPWTMSGRWPKRWAAKTVSSDQCRPTRHSTGDVNHGKYSSKFNQDCTICRTCRWPMADCSVPKWRENGIEWRESRSYQIPCPSHAELAKMIVKVSPAEQTPFLTRDLPEDRMCTPLFRRIFLAHTVHQGMECRDVVTPFG